MGNLIFTAYRFLIYTSLLVLACSLLLLSDSLTILLYLSPNKLIYKTSN